MTDVVVAESAADDLGALIRTLGPSADARIRVQRSLRGLERFPLIGRELTGRWDGARFVLGPWRWLLCVYDYSESEDRVVVLAFHDARSSTAATARRS